jgi:hypothetical protein
MPAIHICPARTVIATLAVSALTAAAAPANTGFPNIHTPHLLGADSEFADPVTAEFGGTFDVYIGNSDPDTVVRACISSHCQRLFPYRDNRYAAFASNFDLRLERGQQRTVQVTATNGEHRSQWGSQTVTVR